MFGMMRSQMHGFQDINGPSTTAMGPGNPGGSMALTGGGMSPMGSIQNINQQTVTGPSTDMQRQNAGGVGFNNPVGGMLGSIFRVF